MHSVNEVCGSFCGARKKQGSGVNYIFAVVQVKDTG